MTEYRKKPVMVEAEKFDGSLRSVQSIIVDLDADVLFVPRGYEHDLRRDHERVDVGGYVAREEAGLVAYTREDFCAKHERWIDSFGDGRYESAPVEAR